MPVVRLMVAEDIACTAALFQEMQEYYRVACPPLDTIEATLSNLPDGISIIVAADPMIVGFAAVGTIFPGPGLSPGLFLKELFVSAQARGLGIGTALVRAAASLAVEQGFTRVDWTADRSNKRLLAFYEATGATEQSEKVFFRLSGQALVDFASLTP